VGNRGKTLARSRRRRSGKSPRTDRLFLDRLDTVTFGPKMSHARCIVGDPMNTKRIGEAGEQFAVAHLLENGWEIVVQNYRRREGEIDIIVRRGDTLAFVEVKTRRSAAYGTPAEAVTPRKASRIRLLARRFLLESGRHAGNVRFDVIEVTRFRGQAPRLTHIEGAF
jgi:putative endonuclease